MRAKFLFLVLVEILLVVWSIHYYITSELSELGKIAFSVFIIFGPLILSCIAYLFRRSLFRMTFIISSICLIMFFSSEYFLPNNYRKEFGAETAVALDHFKKKAGFFSSYKSIVVSYDYPDSI